MNLPLKTLIVENEWLEVKALVKRLKKHYSFLLDIEHADIATSFDEAENMLKNHYDITFLDIDLGDETCFRLFDIIDTDNLGMLVYITGTDQYENSDLAKLNPHFFIAKPPNEHDLEIFFEQFTDHLNKLKDVESRRLPFFFKVYSGWISVSINEIYLIEASNVYSNVYVIKSGQKQKVVVRKTLKDMEKILNSSTFWRIQKSFLVNSEHVSIYIPSDRSSRSGEVIFNDNIHFDDVRPLYSMDYLEKFGSAKIK